VRFREIDPSFPAVPKTSTLRSPQLSAIAYLIPGPQNDTIKATLNVMSVAKWQSHDIDEASAYDIHSQVFAPKKECADGLE
jgi:hypothetical protein